MVNQERIDNYIRGKMSAAEEAQFIADCKTNLKLRKQAVITAWLVKGLQRDPFYL